MSNHDQITYLINAEYFAIFNFTAACFAAIYFSHFYFSTLL